MSRTDDLRLMDIIESCQRIARLRDRGHESYVSDEAIQPAIERHLEIIGESANVLGEDTREAMPAVEWRDLRRLRILLVHHYHRVDPDQVWVMATVEVPGLLAAIYQARSDLRPV